MLNGNCTHVLEIISAMALGQSLSWNIESGGASWLGTAVNGLKFCPIFEIPALVFQLSFFNLIQNILKLIPAFKLIDYLQLCANRMWIFWKLCCCCPHKVWRHIIFGRRETGGPRGAVWGDLWVSKNREAACSWHVTWPNQFFGHNFLCLHFYYVYEAIFEISVKKYVDLDYE